MQEATLDRNQGIPCEIMFNLLARSFIALCQSGLVLNDVALRFENLTLCLLDWSYFQMLRRLRIIPLQILSMFKDTVPVF